MRSLTTIVATLSAIACIVTPGTAQTGARPAEKTAPGKAASDPATGEDAGVGNVDPAVLDRCRQQAAEQKLKVGSALKAFMETCTAPED